MKTPEILKTLCSYSQGRFQAFKDIVLEKYGKHPGKMLIHTGVLGWILSSLGQITAVAFNDKIPTEQKSFIIPQEIADAFVNIASFYVVTQSVKSLGSKLVTSGKISSSKIREFVSNLGKKSSMGKWDFNISKLDKFKSIEPEFEDFKNGIDVYASLAGSVVSCNIITPIIRNKIAANRQKNTLARINAGKTYILDNPRGISMEKYLERSYSRSSSLKI